MKLKKRSDINFLLINIKEVTLRTIFIQQKKRTMSTRLYFCLFAILFCLGIEGKAIVDRKLSQRINHLLNITEFEKRFSNTLEAHISNDPNLLPFKSNLMNFIDKFISFKSLRLQIVEIYRDLYSLSDINGLIKFYSSSLGKKFLEKENKAAIQLIQLIQKQLEKQMPQIVSWFQQELMKDYSNQTIH